MQRDDQALGAVGLRPGSASARAAVATTTRAAGGALSIGHGATPMTPAG